jgi:ATP-dependent protease ClpP protease subunit
MYELVKNQTDKVFDVYINGAITSETSRGLVEDIKLASKAGFKKLTMHINSFGGSVSAAWDIVSIIKSIKDLHVVTVNEGFALSAGAVLLASGDERIAFDFSTAMIHDPIKNGKTLEELEGSDKEFMKKVKDGILSIYNKVFNVSEKILSKMLTDTTNFNAEEQLSVGLVQKIIEKLDKPFINNDLPVEEVCNVITEFNKNNIQTNKINKMKEVLNYLGLEEDVAQDVILNLIKEKDSTIEKISNEIKEVQLKLENVENETKLENFLVENKLEDKKEDIQKAVKEYGIDVLNSLIVSVSNEKEVKEKITNIVNEANDDLANVKDTSGDSKEKELVLANELFDVINGDEIKANELKESDPAKYERLVNLYYEIEE